MKAFFMAIAAGALAGAAAAQDFIAAAEVRPVLQGTKRNWVAIRQDGGSDLVYFTHVLSWRCGLEEVRYGLNGAAAETRFPLEPCHEGTAQPNAIVDTAYPIYIAAPAGSVQSVTVRVVYDDGGSDTATLARSEVLMP